MDDGITVMGVGQAAGVPDVFRIDLAAEVVASSATGALRGAGEALDRMRGVLATGGVVREDLQSGAMHLWPEYADGHRSISGYRAKLGLVAHVRNLQQAGVLLADTVAAGGDASRLDGATFEHADPASLLARARERAWRDATAKAEQYAALAGRRLGAVRALAERHGSVRPLPRADIALARESVPIEPGTSAVSVEVDARWEFA